MGDLYHLALSSNERPFLRKHHRKKSRQSPDVSFQSPYMYNYVLMHVNTSTNAHDKHMKKILVNNCLKDTSLSKWNMDWFSGSLQPHILSGLWSPVRVLIPCLRAQATPTMGTKLDKINKWINWKPTVHIFSAPAHLWLSVIQSFLFAARVQSDVICNTTVHNMYSEHAVMCVHISYYFCWHNWYSRPWVVVDRVSLH